MFYSLLKRKSSIEFPSLSTSYMKLSSKQVESKGVLTRVSVFESSDSATELSKFFFDDFSLQNILALGAYDQLKPVYAPDVNPLNVIDSVENTLNSLSDVSKASQNK